MLLTQLTGSPCVDVVTDAPWSPSCLKRDATMCFISLTFSRAGHGVRSTAVSFGLFIKEKPNALETVETD